MAALQGVAQRARQLRGAYTSECEAAGKAQHKALAEDTARLLVAGDDFLRSCALFAAGGAYDADEVAVLRADVEALAATCQAGGAARDAAVRAVEGEMRESLTKFDEFVKEYDRVIKELSMREGLGPRFGAPRRGVINVVRSAVGKSEEAAALIDARLDELRALLSERPAEPALAKPAWGRLASEASRRMPRMGSPPGRD